MSRLSYLGCAALIAGLVLTTSLSAQQGRRGGGFGGRGGAISPLFVVANEAVQKEIGITDDQKAKLTELGKEYQEAAAKVRTDAGITGGGGGGGGLSEEQRTKLTEGMMKVNDEFGPKLKSSLKPEQFERVQQIAYQVAGPNAFTISEVVKALDLTKEQQEKIATVNKDFQEKVRALGADGGPEAFTRLRDDRSAELAKILTKEQTDKWTALKGKAFDTSVLQFGGGRGGRPGGKKKAD